MAHAFLLNPEILAAAIKLQTLDWVIIIGSILVCFVPALFVGKKSGESTSEFFASGRSVPWWLAGLSMVATTFSSDTPNWVTQQVRELGVAGNWQWWGYVLTGISTVFFFARLWRRSGVLTDLEFYELRYSGKEASLVRGFRAVYLGLFFNCFIMGMVTLAACKIADILFGMPAWQTIVICGVLNVVFAAHSGLWGVLVIDMVQFFIKMTAVFAAAYFSLQQVAIHFGVGADAYAGLQKLVSHLSTMQVTKTEAGAVMSQISGEPTGQPILAILPSFHDMTYAWKYCLVFLAIGWWAFWYPGAEPGGGSYIAQRMLASKTEKDSLGGTLFFNLAHYVLRPWPWIITALCSIVIFPDLDSIRAQFSHVSDPSKIGNDSAFPAMLTFLPVGFMGLMIGGLIAANSSTILTHLNWGASYLVHDFYRRFMNPTATEKHYVNAGRLCTLGLYVVAALISLVLSTAQEAFDALINIGAGTGLLYIARWFWWRVTAWCEIVAMSVVIVANVTFFVLKHNGVTVPNTSEISIALTTVAWILTAYFGPQTDKATLLSFFRKVQPAGPGWAAIRREANIPESEKVANHMGLATLGWVAGCAVIWSSLFAIGKFLYGETQTAWILTAIFVVSGLVLLRVIRKLWT